MKNLTRENFLRDRLEMAQHNLDCYSSNFSCTSPKEGMENQHKETAAEVEMLRTWLKEFHSTNTESTREFTGNINGWSSGTTWNGKPLAIVLDFEVETGADYLYGDRRIFNLSSDVQHWFIGENGGCGKYDTEKDCRESRLVKITVDKIEYVRSIEWAVNEEEVVA
jgi:hypothetical protein